MNLTKKITFGLGLIAVAGISYAQSASSSEPVGLLGQKYSEIAFGVNDIKHVSPNIYDLGVSGNVPVSANIDVGAGYSYSWARGAIAGHANTLSGGATAYMPLGKVKPFVGLGLGYQWTHFGRRDHQVIWAAGAGVEIPAGFVTLTPSVIYTDDFDRPAKSSHQVTYQVEANHWLTPTTAVFASVGFTDVDRTNLDAWGYGVGFRAKF
jgi:hypothetical protein